jgi:hypothetical protein
MARIRFRGHHNRIPDLRPDSVFELGALKSYLKSGKFKGMLPGAVGAGLGAAFAGSASDALADTLIPGGVEAAGSDSDKTPGPEITQFSPDPELSSASKKELKMMQEFGTGETVLNPKDEARQRMKARYDALQRMRDAFKK